MIRYAILSNISIILFYLLYKALLQQDSFLKWRRAYLLLAIAFSLTFPLLQWSFVNVSVPNAISLTSPNTDEQIFGNLTTVLETVLIQPQETNINWYLVAYLSVTVVLSIVLSIRLIALFMLKKRAKPTYIDTEKVWISHKNISPFSFFKLIMLGKNDRENPHLKMILQHEKTHVEQWHSIDVILCELLTVIYFFNPFVYLLKKEVRINLEYLADQNCTKIFREPKAYQYAILQVAINQPYISISNYFNYSPIKQRIMMLNKKQSSQKAMLKYLSILPVVMGLFLLSQCTDPVKQDKSDKTQKDNKIESFDFTVNTPYKANTDTQTYEKIEEYAFLDKQPVFNGTDNSIMEYLMKNIRYPKEAKERGIEGRLYVQFVIDSIGKVRNVEILRASGQTISLSKDTLTWTLKDGTIKTKLKSKPKSDITDFLNKNTIKEYQSVNECAPQLLDEAIRVVKEMPDWTPGEIDNKTVNVHYQIPIIFKL